MKKSNVVTAVIVLGVGGAIAALTISPGILSGASSSIVREKSEAFLEDLQFKDFKRSTIYHHKLERDRLDIGKATEQLFMIKPELLDIREQEIVRIDMSEDGRRAKTLTRARYRRLNLDGDLQEKDLLLYWIKRHPDCPLSSTCDSAQDICVDATGLPILQKEYSDTSKKSGLTRGDAGSAYEQGEDHYACDPSAQDEWFMNLDSTLKSKSYN